jgi:hypothetical protein
MPSNRHKPSRPLFSRSLTSTIVLGLLAAGATGASINASADDFGVGFFPGNLVVSRSVYDNRSANVQVGEILPPGCAQVKGGCGAATGAPADGTYPFVWNNVLYDANFGVTSKIFLDQMTPSGFPISSIEVPNTVNASGKSDQLVTSFSSKSELALHLSSDGQDLSFVGYVSPIDALDVSNSNTPGVVDPTNPDAQNFFRGIATVDRSGHFTFTETNAYSGDNGRAAILIKGRGKPFFFSTGNAGNGSNPQPAGVIEGTGVQFVTDAMQPESRQSPTTPTPLGSFSVTQLGVAADKIGKDDNFRGITIFNNVVYVTKGSGSNGVNTVYFLDTTGKACPSGSGVPSPTATLPNTPLTFDAATVQSTGLPSNMCILAGFPSTPNKTATTTGFPFGLWFADANTLYVADEGDGFVGGTDLFTHAAAQTTAGLQKWVFNAGTKKWTLAYTLQNGLGLGVPYTVKGYPMGSNAATGLPWSPATDGLRSLVGTVNRDGTVTLWATTSTVSGNGDPGADPNRLVAVQDQLKNTSANGAARERFITLRSANFAEVLRGVTFTPGTVLGAVGR